MRATNNIPLSEAVPVGNFIHVRKTADDFTVDGEPEYAVIDHQRRKAAFDDRSVWTKWLWNGAQLVVENCPLGLVPTFYYQTGDQIIVATSIQAILDRGIQVSLDDKAMSLLLYYETCIDDQTPFQEIRYMPPGTRLCWDGSEISILRSPRPAPRPLSLSPLAALRQYNELVSEAVKRRLFDEPFLLPLTGGRDSRHILFELLRQDAPPLRCLTSAAPRDAQLDDLGAARSACEILDLPHETLPLIQPTLRNTLRKNVASSYLVPGQHDVAYPLAIRLRRLGMPIFDGIGGDVWVQSHGFDAKIGSLYQAEKYEELADIMLMPSDGAAVYLDDAHRGKWSREQALALLAAELPRYRDYANPVCALRFANYTRHTPATYTFGLLAGALPVACPYLDRDLLDFVSALPPEHSVQGDFHTKAIALADPGLVDIPYAAPIPAPVLMATRIFSLQLLGHGLRAGSGIFRMERLVWHLLKRAIKGDYKDPHILYLLQLQNVLSGQGRFAYKD